MLFDVLTEWWFGARFFWWTLCGLAAGAIALVNFGLQIVLAPLRVFAGPRRFASRAWRRLADLSWYFLDAAGSVL